PERRERARLILGERLRGIEVERAELRLLRQRIEDGQVEGERLPARGSGGDDDVLPPLGRVERLRLVAVDAVEPEVREGLEHPRVEPGRDGNDVRTLSRDLASVCELLAL